MKSIHNWSKLCSLIVVVLLSLYIGRDLLKPNFFRSHDGLFHIVRLQQFDLSFRSGQIPVRWAPTLNGGIGYPLFIVNYTLPYYIAEAIHLFGFDLFGAIKLTLLLSLVGGSVSSFFVYKSWTKSYITSIVGSFLYTIAPYRLANIFERGAVGESFAYIFVPLLFHVNFNVVTIGLTGLILSHTVIAIMFLPWVIAYHVIRTPNKFITIRNFSLVILVASCLSAFQLMPILLERRYMQFDANLLTYYLGHFRPWTQLLRIPAAGINLGTRFQVGIIHALIFILGIKKRQWLFVFMTIISFLLIIPSSKFIWQITPIASYILYPWRWLGVVGFAISSIYVLSVPRQHALISGIVVIVLSLYAYRHYIKVDEVIQPRFPVHMLLGNGTTQNEFDPIWMSQSTINQPKTATSTLYFPGWSKSPDKYGLIYGADLKFKETPVRYAGNLITGFTALSIIGYYALRLRPH